MKIGFIGLGTMGFPMAGHLISDTWQLLAFNRNTERAQQWAKHYNGQVCDSIAELTTQCDVIISCVGNDNDVREIYCGDDMIFANIKPSTTLIDHTTTSALIAKEIGLAASEKNCSFLDAPVSGGEAGAKNASLSAMVGGDKAQLDSITPILASYCKSITHMGDIGSGQLCKMANQLCIAGILQGLSEALVLAERSGLDVATVVQAISGGAAGSWQMLNRANTMGQRQFDFGFAIDWMRKDLDICLTQAKNVGLQLPCAEMVDQQYAKLQNKDEGRSDTSVLIKQFN